MRSTIKIMLFAALTAIFSFTLLAQNPAKEKFADYNGVKVRYTDAGKGKTTLVFVHCWSCNAEFWKEQVDDFPGHRVIALDLPGHGKSDKPQTNYTMEYFAGAVDAVLRNAKVKKAVLIGHSMGTPVIVNFNKLHPKKVLGLVVVDGQVLTDPREADGKAFAAQMKADYKNFVPKFLDEITGAATPELKSWIVTQMMANPEFVGVSAMDSLVSNSSYPQNKITAPVLVVIADSPQWPADTETKLRAVTPNLTFLRWKGVDHFLHLEKPKEFNAAMKEFLTKNEL